MNRRVKISVKGAENTQLCNESLVFMLNSVIFLINFASTLFLSGLIWMVQLVHYPSFHFVDPSEFKRFHQFHSRRISIIVIPLMIIELITSGVLWFHSETFSINSIGFYLVLSIWVSTAFLSVPAHSKLSSGKNDEQIDKLIHTNWVRTFLWTLKSVLMLFLLLQ